MSLQVQEHKHWAYKPRGILKVFLGHLVNASCERLVSDWLWVICQEDIYHPQNSDIYHPQIRTFPTPKKKHLPGGQLPPPIFFFFFWRTFLGFFDLQQMEDIKDEKEEVLDEVVMEHIK